MKQNLFLLMLVFLYSCSSDICDTDSTTQKFMDKGILSPMEAKISYIQALSIANQAPSRFVNELTKTLFKSVHNCEPLTVEPLTKSGLDTLIYVFNYTEGGYVVIPALNIESDIIAYIEEGDFNLKDTLTDDLSAFLVSLVIDYQKSMVSQYEKEITETKASSSLHNSSYPMSGPKCFDVIAASGIHFQNLGEPTQTPEYIARKGDAYYKDNGCIMPLEYTYVDAEYIEPLLTTKWGQSKPYNSQAALIGYFDRDTLKFDRAVAGCLSIAVSQIMAYHAHPTIYPNNILNFNLPTELKRYVNTITALSDIRRRPQLTQNSSQGMKEYTPRFIAIIGYMLNNTWGLEETGAFDSEVPKVFNNMGYASLGTYLYNGQSVESSLNGRKPVYISGRRTPAKGHAWVVDGYKVENMVREDYDYYFDEFGSYHGRCLREPYGGHNTRTIYFHHNFGWSGNHDGYYLDGVFDTSKRYESTGGNYGENRVYKKIKIIADIKKI